MYTSKDIAEYYNTTQIHYEKWWGLKKGLSLHYGIWEEGTKTFNESLNNTNKVLMELSKISESDKVLDAGCGVGGAAIFLHKHKNVDVIGITLSEKQLDFANAAAKERKVEDKVKFMLMDYTKTTFESASFDVIWACESMSSAHDKMLFIKEAYRLLKKGGRLILSDFFITDEETGLEFGGLNTKTQFIGNVMSNTTNYDVVYGGTLNEEIGSQDFPAKNYFSSNSSIDIELVNTPTMLNYWLPFTNIQNTDPQSIPLSWKPNSNSDNQTSCQDVDQYLNVDFPTTLNFLLDYCTLLELYNANPNDATIKAQFDAAEEKIKRIFYYVYDQEWSNLDDLLKQGCDFFFKKKLYSLYLSEGKCVKATLVLDEIEGFLTLPVRNTTRDIIERERIQSFVTTQRIALKYECENPSIDYVFTQADKTVLLTEANKSLPEASDATSLYYLATGEILPTNWYSGDGSPQLRIGNKENTLSDNKSNWVTFPNPAAESITITSYERENVDVVVEIFDVFGNRIISSNEKSQYKSNIELDVSDLPNGVFFLNVRNSNVSILYTQRIVINH